MIQQYIDLKHTIEQSKWNFGLDRIDKISYKNYKL